MSRTSFKYKIIIPAVIVIIVLVTFLTVFLSLKFSDFSDSLVEQKLISNIESLEYYLEDSAIRSQAAVISMMENPDVIKSVKEKNREEILRIFTPMLDLYRINFYTILDSEGNVLVRVHEPDNFGDSLAYQQNIHNAIDGKISTFFEEGTAVKISVRTGVPVYDTDGTLIGVLSSGMRFDTEEEVAVLKDYLNSDVAVFLGDTIISTSIESNGQSISGATLDPAIAKIVIENKQEYSCNIDFFGETYKTFYKPLLDAQGEVFAEICIAMPLAEIKSESNNFIRNGVAIGLIGLIISVLLLFFIISSISQPLTVLADNMDDFADGKLHIDITTNSEDEIGRLSKSMQKSVDTIQKLLTDINVMISEQATGNFDYSFDTENYHGLYGRLADEVLELASFGMNDHLTGIPNRRCFDNRLEVEWNRAKREKSPISLMMLDIDKFKDYNDIFGHQQGDVALQTVSNTLKQSINRSVDLCARWGGEEFVVLLPGTDTKGAHIVAEFIRSEIAKMVIPCPDVFGDKITVSIGVYTKIPEPGDTIDEFISITDNALYQAKEKGRNCCIIIDRI